MSRHHRPTLAGLAGGILLTGSIAAMGADARDLDADTPLAVVFSCGFESEASLHDWGVRQPDERLALVSHDDGLGFQPLRGKALRIRIDKGGHYGASLVHRFAEHLGEEPEEIHFRYYLRFADDWDPERGGKLPGFAGTYGKAGWGGRPVDGTDGWSARGLFTGRKDGRTTLGFYGYHADMAGKYGDHWEWDRQQRGRLENNRWFCIEQFVRLNTPGENDGILRAWVDGKLAFEKTDVRFRDVPTLRIEAVWLNVYLGGTWTAKSNHHLYIDEVAVSRRPIGPLPETTPRE